MIKPSRLSNEDKIILQHTGDEYDKYLNAVVPPVFMNSLHCFNTFDEYRNIDIFKDDNYIYGRSSNPTTTILEKKVAALEHGKRAAAFSCGMAAFTAAVMTVCRSGSHIICMKDVYMPVKRFLQNVLIPRFNMTVTYVSGTDLSEIEDAANENTALMIIESPATFVFSVTDLKKVAEIAHRKGFKTYIDNTCLTPIFQKPLDFGIDIVMHTMSKYLGGHSDLIGGILISKDEELMEKIIRETRELFGGVLGPMEAWLVIRGLRTLDVRMQEYQKTGKEVAEYLSHHNKVKKVYYTGLENHPQQDIIQNQQMGHSSLMSFELDTDDVDKAIYFIDHLKLFGKGCSWGGFESLALLPLYKESDEDLSLIGQHRGLVRIYCGLEGSDNLIDDLEQALELL